MKLKIVLVAGLATTLLAACHNPTTEKKEITDEKSVEKPVSNTEKEESIDKENKEELSKNESTENDSAKSDKESAKKDEGQKSKESHKDHSSKTEKDEHKHDHNISKLDLKAEDIIVSYFNAISSQDVNTLDKLAPNDKDENSQLAKLFQSSKINADIVKMDKISLNESAATYKVLVKLTSKEKDDSFTNNKSEYKLDLDLNKHIIKTKTIGNTEYLQ
ncbi:hypothetical protein [Bacillus toyonensis]|uniref:hypothetical protein n=1 Tax=Bacillus toyonensis TaxID=155322 RepID=UPI002E224C6F|nr:hypothetical protein [Bacillus toyonensis]